MKENSPFTMIDTAKQKDGGMGMKMDYEQLLSVLRGHKIYIQTHNYPDPDAVASGFGLQKFLAHHDIESVICYDGTIEKLNTKMMLDVFHIESYHISELKNLTEEDFIVLVDSQKSNSNITNLTGEEVACIDHHPTFVLVEYRYKDIRTVGACATLIAEYFKESGTPLDSDIATALIYGIRIDTNNLTRGVTQLDIDMYSYLFPYLDQERLNKLNNSALELRDLQAYGAAFENIKIYNNIGFAMIPFDCPDALIAMVADFILSLDVVQFTVVYSKRKDGLKVSCRSELSYLDAGQIIRKALEGIGTGGGHATMAGGFIPSTPARNDYLTRFEIEKRFIDACENPPS